MIFPQSRFDYELCYVFGRIQHHIHYENHDILFDENAGVVVRGNLKTDGTFKAIEVLAKHDENYMPPELGNIMRENVK